MAIGPGAGRAVGAVEHSVDPPLLGTIGAGDSRAVGAVEQAVDPPLLGAIGAGDSWAVGAVKTAVEVPRLAAVRKGDGRSIGAVKTAVEEPYLSAVRADEILWLRQRYIGHSIVSRFPTADVRRHGAHHRNRTGVMPTWAIGSYQVAHDAALAIASASAYGPE